jgi:hypothetical protein
MLGSTGDLMSRGQLLRLALAAIVGGVLGLGAESVHQRAGVWELSTEPHIPVWIVGVYAPCLFAAGLLSMRFERAYRLEVSGRRLAVEVGLFIAGFLAPVALHTTEWGLLAASLAYVAVRLLWGRERGDVAFALFVVAVDLTVEGVLVGASLYRYPNAHMFPLPLWLGPLWAGLAFSLRRFFRVLGT